MTNKKMVDIKCHLSLVHANPSYEQILIKIQVHVQVSVAECQTKLGYMDI